MNALLQPATSVPNASYEETRFSALHHGVLSRHAVLPWEDRAEYQTLLDALVAEHMPQGLTEEHLVEELAGVIWRKRRLQLAEAAVYRERLRKEAANTFNPEQIAGAALLPRTGMHKAKADLPQALAAAPSDTARDLRDVRRDQAKTTKAVNILTAGGPNTYARAVAALREEPVHSGWNVWRRQMPATRLTSLLPRRWRLGFAGTGRSGMTSRSRSLSTATQSGSRRSVPRMRQNDWK
jgi:hypothetical protein